MSSKDRPEEKRDLFEATGELKGVYDLSMARARALEHAQKNFGKTVKGKHIPLIWDVEKAAFNEDDDCFDIVLSCHPEEGEYLRKGEWVYHVSPKGELLPGTPLLRSSLRLKEEARRLSPMLLGAIGAVVVVVLAVVALLAGGVFGRSAAPAPPATPTVAAVVPPPATLRPTATPVPTRTELSATRAPTTTPTPTATQPPAPVPPTPTPTVVPPTATPTPPPTPTRTPAPPTPNPTPTPGPSTLTGFYRGTTTNLTVGQTAPFELQLQESGIIVRALSGYARVYPPLLGEGPLEGQASGNQLQFSIRVVYLGTLLIVNFDGNVSPDGTTLAGRYSIPLTGEVGTWQVTRAG